MRDGALGRDGWTGSAWSGIRKALVTEQMVPPDSETCGRGRVDECSGVEGCHGGRGVGQRRAPVYKGKDKADTQFLITPISSGRSTAWKVQTSRLVPVCCPSEKPKYNWAISRHIASKICTWPVETEHCEQVEDQGLETKPHIATPHLAWPSS